MKRNRFYFLATPLSVLLIFILCFISSCQQSEVLELENSVIERSTITEEQAAAVATNFSNKNSIAYRNTNEFHDSQDFSEKKINKIYTITDDQEIPALYIIQYEPKGFIIVSASTEESPILGYSENTVYDNRITNGFSTWLNSRRIRIQNLRRSDKAQVPSRIDLEWKALMDFEYSSAPPVGEEEVIPGPGVEEQVGPLLQTKWGQDRPYNQYTPLIGYYENALTGCVATSVAQVMKYWAFPNTFSWSTMPLAPAPIDAPEPGVQEIARLMYDIGINVGMTYAADGSTAKNLDARNALVNTYGYSGTAAYVNFSVNTVVSQLKANQPVIMDGVDITSQPYIGHSWVCDGYKRTKYVYIHNPGTRYEYESYQLGNYYLHMNWGWDGAFDGWFLYNDFTPGDDNYNVSNRCIINIHP